MTGWTPRNTANLTLVLSSLTAVVLLAIFGGGAYVAPVLAFASGLLIPGSPLGLLPGTKGSGPTSP